MKSAKKKVNSVRPITLPWPARSILGLLADHCGRMLHSITIRFSTKAEISRSANSDERIMFF